jgi:nickel-dependent lactate racemase
LGVTREERSGKYREVGVHNHHWERPETFQDAGVIPAADIAELAGGLMKEEVKVSLNRMVFGADRVIIWGPVFPHEVVGFSGGHKYFFPGIAGREIIDFTHWLGAVITSMKIIGTRDTPVRRVIERAAGMIPAETLCFCPVVKGHADLAGLFAGEPYAAWQKAAELSAKVHIIYVDQPFQRVLSVMPEMYEDLWTGAKGMYKMEPAIADGGEVVIYAPHITEVSYVHGQLIDRIGYHVRDYFLKQWNRWEGESRCVLAHSTHLRGSGTYENGVERPRIRVTLATGIPRERCEKINLGYLDPATIKLEEWKNRENEGVLLVPRAGEMLYRLRS